MPHDDLPAPTVSAHAVARYREEQVNNLSQKDLILMLYDGAIRFCDEARTAIEADDVSTSYEKLVRVRAIVTELFSILNPDVDVEPVRNLRRLYDFCIYGVTQVNFSKDLTMLDGVVDVLTGLRDTWAEIDFQAAVRELVDDPLPSNGDGIPPETDDANGNGNGDVATSGISLTA